MSTDPIQLVDGIYAKSGLSKTPAKTTGTGSDPAKTQAPAESSSPDYSISPTLSALMTQAQDLNLQGSAKAVFNQSALSAQNQSSLVSTLPGSDSAEANLLGQISLYKQYSTLARGAAGTAASESAKSEPNPIDSLLAESKAQGTRSPTLSSQAQAMIQEGTKAATDKGLAATDQTLAQIVGISRAIQGS